MFAPRPFLFLLSLTLLLLSCSSGKRRVFIVTSYDVATPKALDTTFEVTLSSAGAYARKHEVIVEGKSLSIVQEGKRIHFTIEDNGQYLLNLGEDTLLSNPAQYSRQMFPGTDISATIDARRRNSGLPSGNQKADAILSRLERARAAAEKRKEEENIRKGHSSVQTILPGTLARISRNESARLFILTEPPKQVEVEQGTEPEYYEINTFSVWMKRIQNALREQLEEGSSGQYDR